EAAVDDLADALALVARRQVQPGVEAGLGRLIALVATEDEVDGGEHVLALEAFDDLDPGRRVELAPGVGGPSAAGPTAAPAAGRLVVEPPRLGVGTSVQQRRQ